MDSRPDSAAQAALAASVRRPVTFAFLDLKGEPIRVTNAPYSFTFAGTGDEDLDGFTFDAVDPRVVSVGPVKPFATARIDHASGEKLTDWHTQHDSEGVMLTWDPDFDSGSTLTIGQFKRARAAFQGGQ
jgi:hypothetical protein